MKTLVEDVEKLEYLTSDSRWTKNAGDGKDFELTQTAFQAAKQETMGQFNIVGYFPDTKQLINLDHGRGKRASETTAV